MPKGNLSQIRWICFKYVSGHGPMDDIWNGKVDSYKLGGWREFFCLSADTLKDFLGGSGTSQQCSPGSFNALGILDMHYFIRHVHGPMDHSIRSEACRRPEQEPCVQSQIPHDSKRFGSQRGHKQRRQSRVPLAAILDVSLVGFILPVRSSSSCWNGGKSTLKGNSN